MALKMDEICMKYGIFDKCQKSNYTWTVFKNQWFRGVEIEQKINKILNDIDVIYHLAALADIVPSIQNPDFYYNSNVNGTFNLIRNCEKKK